MLEDTKGSKVNSLPEKKFSRFKHHKHTARPSTIISTPALAPIVDPPHYPSMMMRDVSSTTVCYRIVLLRRPLKPISVCWLLSGSKSRGEGAAAL